MGIGKLDTVKDKNGMRFRVVDIHTNDGQITAILKGIHSDNSPRRGAARKVRVDVLERDYTRIDLPPVTIRKIDDLSEEDKPVVKEPTPIEKAAQIEKEAVRELSKKDIEKAVEASTFGGKVETPEASADDAAKYKKRVTDMMQMTYNLRKDNEILKAEILDMKKTISKMQYAHQEEVRALEDELAETKILAKKRGEAVDELDECCVTFSKIRFMANTAVDMAASLRKMAHMIEEEAEEHC